MKAFRKPSTMRSRGEDRFELVFELGSETRLSRFVVVHLVVDLDNGQPVNP